MHSDDDSKYIVTDDSQFSGWWGNGNSRKEDLKVSYIPISDACRYIILFMIYLFKALQHTSWRSAEPSGPVAYKNYLLVVNVKLHTCA